MSNENEPNVTEGQTQTEPAENNQALNALLAIAEAQKANVDKQKAAKEQELAIKAGHQYAALMQTAKSNPKAALEHLGIDLDKLAPQPKATEPDNKLYGKLESLEKRLADRERKEQEAARQRQLDEVYTLVDAHIESNKDKYVALSRVGKDYREAVFNKMQHDMAQGRQASEAEAASYVDNELISLAESLYDVVAERRKANEAKTAPEKKEEKPDVSSSTVPDDINLSRNQKLARLVEATKRAIKE